ncbi:hypothetical protein PAXRUDRAFT_153078 [Paxillus rubicundulus Ve08.2h10]|uniref:Uncharacterized protein n=1 Tax=Paxillus rubicundulus Ve08.2h10 TaxID=930991 RepID=A0A0D0D5G8_9AGAM|nr:hypothetical protein PAXRUDRAFT_153078 [Paxillus rubicundulus Ve08.2h10]
MAQLTAVLDALKRSQITASQFILSILTQHQYNEHPVVRDLLLHSPDILTAFLRHSRRNHELLQCSTRFVQDSYLRELREVASKDSGWHFGALSALEP